MPLDWSGITLFERDLSEISKLIVREYDHQGTPSIDFRVWSKWTNNEYSPRKKGFRLEKSIVINELLPALLRFKEVTESKNP